MKDRVELQELCSLAKECRGLFNKPIKLLDESEVKALNEFRLRVTPELIEELCGIITGERKV